MPVLDDPIWLRKTAAQDRLRLSSRLLARQGRGRPIPPAPQPWSGG
jgi:hypothetical protein